MRWPQLRGKPMTLAVVIVPLLGLFTFVALRSGPLAPIAVTTETVTLQSITPTLFGIGTVETRYHYMIGPTTAGRIRWLDAQVGDVVAAGDVLGEMDTSELDARISAQHATIASADARIQQAQAQAAFATSQADRYEQLLQTRGASEELVVSKRMERDVAAAAVTASQAELVRLRAELDSLQAQRERLQLTAPVAGLVVERHADPGTTIVAGQAVIEVVDPTSLWIHARFDQISSQRLTAGLAASVVLRSRGSLPMQGSVLRTEPLADAVTEEMLAKIVFHAQPSPLPPLGELAEVTVTLGDEPLLPVIDNAAIRHVNGQRGVWTLADSGLKFLPIVLGRSTLDGKVQVLEGLNDGERIVVYSEKALTADSRIQIVEAIPGIAP